MTPEIATFTAAAALLVLTPGPDVFLVLRRTVVGGRAAGLRTALGTETGLLVHATAAALGLSAVLAASATAFTAVKIAGAAYLLWLGVQALRGLRNGAVAPVSLTGSPFRQGLLTNVLNPKVAVFFLTFLPQFLGPGPASTARIALLSAIFVGLGAVWLLTLVLVVDRAQPLVARHRQRLEAVSGLAMVGFGARLALVR